MYCSYQDRVDLEDDLYKDDGEDSDGSEANSELEFHLYSQLHYSSNAGDAEKQEDEGDEGQCQDSQQLEETKKTADVDGNGELECIAEIRLPSSNADKKTKKKEVAKCDQQKKGKSDFKSQKSSSLFEEVIVIASSPDVISISEDDTSDDDTADDDIGVCALKGRSFHQLQTSTPVLQVEKKIVR